MAILCSLRPQLVDLSLVQSRSNQENLEEAFHLAERELHIPRLLEPQGEAEKRLNTMFYGISCYAFGQADETANTSHSQNYN